MDNEFDLVFVTAYQKILQLSYVDKFLDDIQLEFRDKYRFVKRNDAPVFCPPRHLSTLVGRNPYLRLRGCYVLQQLCEMIPT